MKNTIIAALASGITLLPTQAIAQTVRLDFFDYGYMEVEQDRVGNWLSGISAAITNSADPQDFPTHSSFLFVEDLSQFYVLTCSGFYNWQEAQFHFMNGSGPLSLDADDDGLACELRTQGFSKNLGSQPRLFQ